MKNGIGRLVTSLVTRGTTPIYVLGVNSDTYRCEITMARRFEFEDGCYQLCIPAPQSTRRRSVSRSSCHGFVAMGCIL